MHRSAICLIAPLLLAGCQPEPAPPPAGVIDTLRLAATPRHVIPDASPRFGYTLQRLDHVKVRSGPQVGLADESELLIFDSTTTLIHHIGQPGEGPGEFRQVTAWAWCGGDTVLVFDAVQSRVSRFDGATLIGETSVRGLSDFARPLMPLTCGPRPIVSVPGAAISPIAMPDETRQTQMMLVATTPEFTRLDTLALAPGHIVYRGLTQPLGATFVAAPAANRIVYGRTSDSVLHVVSSDGTRETVVLQGLPPAVPVTTEMRTARQAWSEASTPPAIWEQELKEIFDGVPWPSVLPRWERLLVDGNGNYWLSDYIAVHATDQSTRTWRQFSPDGALLAQLTLARSRELVGIQDGLAWVVSTTEDGTRAVEGYPWELP